MRCGCRQASTASPRGPCGTVLLLAPLKVAVACVNGLLHISAQITRSQRKVYLRFAEHWPWALALALAKRSPDCG